MDKKYRIDKKTVINILKDLKTIQFIEYKNYFIYYQKPNDDIIKKYKF